MKNKHQRWLLLLNTVMTSLALLVFGLLHSVPVYARMGSSGGGGGSGSGGSGSSGGGWGFSNIDILGTKWTLVLFITILAILTLLRYFSILSTKQCAATTISALGVLSAIGSPTVDFWFVIGICVFESIVWHLSGRKFLFLKWLIGLDTVAIAQQSSSSRGIRRNIDLLTPNLTLDEFNTLVTDDDWGASGDFQNQVELYATSQYDYSQAIRDRLADKKLQKNLYQDLGLKFYYTMLDEINLKVEQKIVDDVIVSNVKVLEAAQVDGYTVLHLAVTGQDREVAYGHDFDKSYEQDQWEDYVVYKDDKIMNIIYGGHFHLNGQDFNDQETLGDYDFEENDFDS